MKDLLEHAGPFVAIGAMVVNFIWSSLNLRLMRNMEKKFVTRESFHAERRVQDVRHGALVDRVKRLESAC